MLRSFPFGDPRRRPLQGRGAVPRCWRLGPLIVIVAACVSPGPVTPDPAVPYDLAAPAATFALDGDLDEISGLTWLPEGHLAAVQDEEPDIYVLDPASGAVIRVHDFGKDGDYEGIEWTGTQLVVLESNGDLHVVEALDGDTVDADVLDTDLPAKSDTEGLAWDPTARRLLIACKEDPDIDLDDVRAIYAYDLEAEERSDEPVFLIDLDAIPGDGDEFKPSALAVHPLTNDIYVLSSPSQSLAVLAPDGALRGVWPLPDRLLVQPEGLAFAPDGTLYVSSEAGDDDAVLVRYAYRSSSSRRER